MNPLVDDVIRRNLFRATEGHGKSPGLNISTLVSFFVIHKSVIFPSDRDLMIAFRNPRRDFVPQLSID